MLVFMHGEGDNGRSIGGKFLKAIRKFALRHLVAGSGMFLAFAAGSAQAGTLDIRVLADGNPVPDAVVYAIPIGAPVPPLKTTKPAIMAQRDQQFEPFVLPIQVGTTVEFPNRDPFRHHVYSFSPAKVFELKLYGSGEVKKVTFDKEGVVALGCNIHDGMLAYIYVVNTPYFAMTTAGTSALDMPAGEYSVRVWHPSQRGNTPPSEDVKVPATGATEIVLNIELKRDRRQQRPRGAADENAY